MDDKVITLRVGMARVIAGLGGEWHAVVCRSNGEVLGDPEFIGINYYLSPDLRMLSRFVFNGGTVPGEITCQGRIPLTTFIDFALADAERRQAFFEVLKKLDDEED
jgi:hypothetical protein